MTLGTEPTGERRYLAALETVRKDFEQLRDFCVTNRFGIGEIHMLYFVLLLSRMTGRGGAHPYDEVLQETVGDVVYLRVPIYRADNLSPFSVELQGRLHAVRLIRAMQKLGILDESPRAKLAAREHADISALLSDPLRAGADAYIPPDCRKSYVIFDTASALEAYARAHAANRAPLDERGPEELYAALRHALRRAKDIPGISEERLARLRNLTVAAVVRACAHVDNALAKKMYALLRSGKTLARVRHGRMFRLLPNNSERLTFLNFLYTNGTQNPVYYVERFQKYFGDDKLQFVRKETGFTLDRGKGQ